MEKRLYIAYGADLSKEWMKHRCPTAEPMAVATLHDHKLVFQGSPHGARANVIPETGQEVPVVVWEISDQDEHRMNIEYIARGLRYQEYIEIDVNGEMVEALIYIMIPSPYGTPSERYLQYMADGYRDFGLPIGALNEAVSRAYENSIINGAAIYAHKNTVEMTEQ